MNEEETQEICDRQYCEEIAVAVDTRNIPVCQHHAEEDWAKD